MSVWGADVAGLQAIAVDLDRYAASVDQARRNVDAQLARTAWEGPNAQAFRSRWRTLSLRDLDGFRQELTTAAAQLRRQAQEQLDASSVHGRDGASSGTRSAGAGAGRIANIASLAGLGAVGREGLASAGLRALLAPSLLPHMLPAAIGGARELFFDDPITTATTVTDLAITALASTYTPTMIIKWGAGEALSSQHLFVNAASHGLLHTAGTVLSAGTAGIRGGFAQWNADIGGDFGTGEQLARAGTVGAVHAGVAVGANVAFTAAAAPLVGPAAPLVGMAASAGTTWAMNTELGQQATGAIADGVSQGFEYGRQAAEGFEIMGDAATDWTADRWEDAGNLIDGAGDLVTSAGDALDAVGGSVQDAVSGTVDRLNLFSH